jgi:rRNA-processing protein EBP2
MAKKSKLLAALDAQKGRDYKLEKQKKLQKQAAKRKEARTRTHQTESESEDEVENGAKLDIPVNGAEHLPQDDSEGWESDESEDASPMTVGETIPPATSICKRKIDS